MRHHPGVPLGTQVLGWTAFNAAERAVALGRGAHAASEGPAQPRLTALRDAAPADRTSPRVRRLLGRRPRLARPTQAAAR